LGSNFHDVSLVFVANDSIYLCFIGIVKRISWRLGVSWRLPQTRWRGEKATAGAEARGGLVVPYAALKRRSSTVLRAFINDIADIYLVLLEGKADPRSLKTGWHILGLTPEYGRK
jgi:hypothetical protein